MKLFKKFIILKKNFRDIDYVTREKVDFWEKEYKEHPNQKHCLVYCD